MTEKDDLPITWGDLHSKDIKFIFSDLVRSVNRNCLATFAPYLIGIALAFLSLFGWYFEQVLEKINKIAESQITMSHSQIKQATDLMFIHNKIDELDTRFNVLQEKVYNHK